MFERFAADARRAVVVANAEATRLGHRHVGTEHLLLGLVRDRSGAAGRALRALGMTADAVEQKVRERAGRPEQFGPSDTEALRAIGIDLDEVLRRVEAGFGPQALRPASPRRMGRLTPEAKRVLEASLREARTFGMRCLASGHLLLGLADVESSSGSDLLRGLGITPASAKARVLHELSCAS